MKRLALAMMAMALAFVAANAQLLWKVEGNGLAKPSYIFGTHHVAPADMIDRVEGLTDALEAVEGAIGEVDMGDMNPIEIQQTLMPHVMAPADSTLSKLFTPEQLDSIDALFASYIGQPGMVAGMEMMKPVMLSTQLALMQSMKAFPGFDPQNQLDQRIQAIVKAAGKTTGGLETFEYQMGVLYDTPVAEQAADLMEAVANDTEAIAKAGTLAGAYEAGDLAEIEKLLMQSEDMTPEKLDKLLLNRNRAWAVKLPAIMAEKPVIVAVGCGHLPGPQGLLALLEAQGYTLTPIDKTR